jgi:hypothetical protein
VSEHTSQTMIPVRVTGYATTVPAAEAELAELKEAMARGGLFLSQADPNAPRWFATQRELDTPHTTFRLSPR